MIAPVGSSLNVSGIRIAVPGGGTQSGQNPDQRAQDATGERVGEVRRAQRGGESRQEVRERVHRGILPQSPNGPTGSGTFSQ